MIERINGKLNTAVQTIPTPKDATSDNKNTKTSKTTQKVMIGSTILAAAIAAGLGVRKLKLNQKFNQKIDELCKNSKDKIKMLKRKNTTYNKQIFDPEITEKQMQEAVNSARKSKDLKPLQEFNEAISLYDRGLTQELTGKNSIDFLTSLPQDIQAAINNKDYIKSVKLYTDWLDTQWYKAPSAGNNVLESIENVFGKESNIKPHTYDLTKEADRIATSIFSRGIGYKDITINSSNQIAAPGNFKNIIEVYNREELYLPENKPYKISESRKDGKPIVTLTYHDMRFTDTRNNICLLSPDSNLTPAQQDLLKLKDLKDFPLQEFKELTQPGKPNFDVILSIIQTYAQKVVS